MRSGHPPVPQVRRWHADSHPAQRLTWRALARRKDVVFALGAGVAYGIATQLLARFAAFGPVYLLMSLGYVFVLPGVLGFITAQAIDPGRGLFATLGLSCLTGLLCLLVAFVVGWEGTICLIMAAPVYLLACSAGGALGYRARHPAGTDTRYPRRFAIAVVLTLPLASGLAESRFAEPAALRVVTSSIDIAAEASLVWQQIARVAPITEPQHSFFFTMGFPRPVEATLSHEGVGGVRHASFEHGLLFIETVTVWQPPRELRFTIAADAAQTPLTTLDAHVVVGGRYFDVLEGGYRIEPLPNRRVRLHLDSRHRISTRFNFYSSLWSDYLMSEIQENILLVLKQRCERLERGGSI
ncbi:MAG: hypothetical protein JWN04_3157 [Myxococcaceae bacterium]|nr:hypothetical protein [Myxococcaceae bacterium]